jgi:hypothetical protein
MEVSRGETLWIAGRVAVLPVLKIAREHSGKCRVVKEAVDQ